MSYGLNTELRLCAKCGRMRWGTVVGRTWICATCGQRDASGVTLAEGATLARVDPTGMWSTLSAMKVSGFTKAEAAELATAYGNIAWRTAAGDGGMVEYFTRGAGMLRALARQETPFEFEYYVGLPERM